MQGLPALIHPFYCHKNDLPKTPPDHQVQPHPSPSWHSWLHGLYTTFPSSQTSHSSLLDELI